MEDSQDNWKYTSVLSKFVINFIDVAISKSFGVLIPVMITVLSTNTKTLGFMCSLPNAWMNLACPIVAYVLKLDLLTPRMVALIGALLSSVCLIAAGYITSVPSLTICLSLTGIGLSMGYLSSKIMINEYFKKSYVLVAAIANFGNTTGAMVAPFVVERALEAYGYAGALLILGGMSLHALPASATMRKPRDSPMRQVKDSLIKSSINQENHTQDLLPDTVDSSSRDHSRIKGHPIQVNHATEPADLSNRPPVPLTGYDRTTIQIVKDWLQNCIFIREPLLVMSLPCILFTAFGLSSWVLFLVPRAEWHGIPSSRAVLLSTIGGAGGVLGRLFYIWFIYLGANAIFLSCIFNMISAITFLADPIISTFPEMCVIAFIQGWSIFSCQIATSAYSKYAVSDENFSLAAGFQGLFSGVGAILGGLVTGLIKDVSQSFTTAFLVVGAVYMLNEIFTVIFYFAYRRRRTISSGSGQ